MQHHATRWNCVKPVASPAGGSGILSGCFDSSFSASGSSPPSSSFRSPRRPVPRRGGTLIRAYPARACAGAGARRRRHRRAPDCACEAQDTRLPQVSQGFFRAGAGMGGSSLRMSLPIFVLALFYHSFRKRKPCADNFSYSPAMKLITKENLLTFVPILIHNPGPGAASRDQVPLPVRLLP